MKRFNFNWKGFTQTHPNSKIEPIETHFALQKQLYFIYFSEATLGAVCVFIEVVLFVVLHITAVLHVLLPHNVCK